MEMASQDMVSCSILVYICIDYRLHDYNLSVCMWGGELDIVFNYIPANSRECLEY